jgi:hypothetical protein
VRINTVSPGMTQVTPRLPRLPHLANTFTSETKPCVWGEQRELVELP